jgi:predicted AlkP superfamily pyrophosphatase or phosphodiesterase
MKPIVFPDYEHSILNVSNSILKHYGAKTFHPTLEVLDKELSKNYRNVVLVLVDALGEDAILKHLPQTSVFRKKMITALTSVFPPTTVAATTSVLSGKSPIETGWLGWHQYIKEEDASIIFFYNKDYYDPTKSYEYQIATKYVPYVDIYTQIRTADASVQTTEIFPAFRTPENDTFEKMCSAIKSSLQPEGRHFVYAYWDKVDSLMHEFGPYSDEVHTMILSVEKAFQEMIDTSGADTIFIVIADHGQVDVKTIQLVDYPDLIATLRRMPSNESRAMVFYVKDSMRDEFETLFNRYFRHSFNLYKSDEILKMKLFGDGKIHDRASDFLGDYVAIATDEFILNTVQSGFVMKGQHAGLLKEEMMVPLIIHSPKK